MQDLYSDFFFGRLKEVGYWQEELAEKFRKDFGESLSDKKQISAD